PNAERFVYLRGDRETRDHAAVWPTRARGRNRRALQRRGTRAAGVSRRALGRGDIRGLSGDARVGGATQRDFFITSGAEPGVKYSFEYRVSSFFRDEGVPRL